MHHPVKFAVLVGCLGAGWGLSASTAQDKKAAFADSSKLEWKAVAPGAAMAAVMGDPDKGKRAAFTKFDPGARFEMHSHSSDMRIVVLKGAYPYKSQKGEERRVGPGMYLWVPGGDHHWSGGDEKEGALFYMDSDGKFDLTFDKK
jgi:quercetin dioxygenase-like cupin family protein